jgi:hypothetical protein
MAISITLYPSFKTKLGQKAIALNADTLKVALLGVGASYNSAHDEWADISAQEIANGSGYTTGGLTLTNVTWTNNAGTVTLDADDASWTITGSAVSAYSAAIVDTTASGSPLIAFLDLGGINTASPGALFKLPWNASGILTLA